MPAKRMFATSMCWTVSLALLVSVSPEFIRCAPLVDLGKATFEVLVAEIFMVKAEITHHYKQLDSWVQPTAV